MSMKSIESLCNNGRLTEEALQFVKSLQEQRDELLAAVRLSDTAVRDSFIAAVLPASLMSTTQLVIACGGNFEEGWMERVAEEACKIADMAMVVRARSAEFSNNTEGGAS